MRSIGVAAAVLFISLLARSIPVTAAAPPTGVPDGSALAALPPISTALEDQLGIKLERGRGSVEVLVIDRLDMPTEN